MKKWSGHTKTGGLGRGLGSLIAEKDLQWINVELITPGPWQVRKNFSEERMKELADSIKEQGVLEPILVLNSAKLSQSFKNTKEQNEKPYLIIAGERRWRAAKLSGSQNIPCRILELTSEKALLASIEENIQRSDLSPIEEARGYEKFSKVFGCTQEDIAKKVSKSRSHIANTIRLLKLPQNVQDMIDEGLLSAGQARTIVSQSNPEELAKKIAASKASVRTLEKLKKQKDQIKHIKKEAKTSKASVDAEAIAQTIEKLCPNMCAKIEKKGSGGVVLLSFDKWDHLDDFIDSLYDKK